MSNYTPIFSSLTTGTLCGRWPDIGLWPIILSIADRNGEVDVTHAYIAGITGLPVDEVVACMARFCGPDPGSRSDIEGGARLVPLESHRDWGWKVVNHGYYREKARLAAKAYRETKEGLNAKRLADRRGPPVTAGDRLLNSKQKTINKEEEPPPEGLDLKAWEQWQTYRRGIKKPIQPASEGAAMRKMAALGTRQAEVVEYSIAQGYQGLWEPKTDSAKPSGPKIAAPPTEEQLAATRRQVLADSVALAKRLTNPEFKR